MHYNTVFINYVVSQRIDKSLHIFTTDNERALQYSLSIMSRKTCCTCTVSSEDILGFTDLKIHLHQSLSSILELIISKSLHQKLFLQTNAAQYISLSFVK